MGADRHRLLSCCRQARVTVSCCAALVLCIGLLTGSATAAQSPNIVIIYGDDVGYGDLECFGHPSSRTPNLNRMAAEGRKAVHWYSAAAVCSPSRSSLLTGRLFNRIGVYSNEPAADAVFSPLSVNGLPLSEITIPKLLKNQGYYTGMCGKSHLGTEQYLPTVGLGFDEYFGAPMTQNECTSNIHNPGSATPSGPFGPCPLFHNDTIAAQGSVDMLEIDQQYVGAATAFIRKAAARNQPFMYYFASHHTHAPQFAGEALTGFTRRGLFGDSLAELDWSVGQILDTLVDVGVANNTLVVFSADNGASTHWLDIGGSAGLLKCGKGTTYEGGVRVPTMFWMPGTVPANTVTQDIGSMLDLFPTIASLVGASMPANVTYDGMDVWSMISGTGPSPRNTNFYYRGPTLMAMRYNTTKLSFYTKGWAGDAEMGPDADCYNSAPLAWHDPPLLVDLDQDPSELRPVPANVSDPIVLEMMSLLALHNSTFQLGEPLIGPSSPKRFPCGSPGCTPLPHCCKCSHEVTATGGFDTSAAAMGRDEARRARLYL